MHTTRRSPAYGGIIPALVGGILVVGVPTLVVPARTDRIQHNFEPMQRRVEQTRSSQIAEERAKLLLYARASCPPPP